MGIADLLQNIVCFSDISLFHGVGHRILPLSWIAVWKIILPFWDVVASIIQLTHIIK